MEWVLYCGKEKLRDEFIGLGVWIWGRTGYFIIPLSSKNSTGSLSLPCSHINEKNQIPLSPIQKSAGVNAIFEPSGFWSLSGVYSACQPKISPFQRFPSE